MLFNTIATVTLATLSAALPVTNEDNASLTPSEDNKSLLPRKDAIKDVRLEKVPKPPAGECALVVISASDLPIGGPPPTGGPIGASTVSNPSAGVMNHEGLLVGEYKQLEGHQDYHFSADIPLNPKYINDAGTVKMTASFVDPAADDWGVKFDYKSQHVDCSERCKHTPIGDEIKFEVASTGNFKC